MAQYGSQMRFGPIVTPMVKNLIIANVAIFVLQFLSRLVAVSSVLETYFGLQPHLVLSGQVWQLLTYSFLHADFFHLLFNLLALWMFGSELENQWGSESFLKFFLFSSFMGGVVTLVAHLFGFPQGLVVGASGGIFGLLIAFAMIWPNREILFMMIFPLKAKFFVMIIMLMIVFSQGGSRVAHMAHLGGAIGGFLYLRFVLKSGTRFQWNWSIKAYFQKRKMLRYQEEMYKQLRAKDKVDELLDKISKSGMDSLSRKEKNFLKEASNKYYND